MRKRIILGLMLTLVMASPAAAENEPTANEYVVYVEKLNLRSEPSAKARSVGVIKKGARVKYLSPDVVETPGYSWDGTHWDTDNIKLPFLHLEITEEDDYVWRKVKAVKNEGWVPDRFVLRADIYDAFKVADERGKAGDAAGMLTAIIEGYEKLKEIVSYEEGNLSVSPDGKAAVAFVDIEWDEGYAFSGTSYEIDYTPLLYFVAGRGLAEYVRSHKRFCYVGYNYGIWSPDSRYFAIPMESGGEWMIREPLDLVYVEKWRRITVGRLSLLNASGFDDTFEYEFFGGYLIWKDSEKVSEPLPPPLEEDSYAPVIMAYKLDTGERIRLLEADLATLGKEARPASFGLKFYDVKMVPAGPCPAALEKAGLYGKFANRFAEVEDRTHWME